MSDQAEMNQAPSCSLTGRNDALTFIQEVEVCILRSWPPDLIRSWKGSDMSKFPRSRQSLTNVYKKNAPAALYKQFLAILSSYAQDPSSIDEVYSQVEDLFASNNDLFTKFKTFLPNPGKKEGIWGILERLYVIRMWWGLNSCCWKVVQVELGGLGRDAVAFITWGLQVTEYVTKVYYLD